MEFSSIISTVKQNLTDELRNGIIKAEIPITSEADPEKCITIFSVLDSKSKKCKSHQKKKVSGTMHFQYCCDLQFDKSKIKNPTTIFDLRLIWNILKPECYQPTVRQISIWCRTFFNIASKVCEKYDLKLAMIPFEVYFDDNDNLHVSRLPEFTDLRFYKDSSIVDATDFLYSYATSVIETSKSLQEMRSSLKSTPKHDCSNNVSSNTLKHITNNEND